MKKKLLSAILIFSFIMLLPLNVSAVEIVKSGTCGENLTWKFDSDGVLTISGTGAMDDFDFGYDGEIDIDSRPWADFCDEISEVKIQEGVTSIGEFAFIDCYKLTDIVLPKGLSTIGSCAFYCCESLNSIKIPDGVIINDSAFGGCYNLSNIVLPTGLTTIAHSTFHSCSDLSSIEIPKSVKTIEWGAFAFCDSLTDVYYAGTRDEWDKILIDEYNEWLTNAKNIHFDSTQHTQHTYGEWKVVKKATCEDDGEKRCYCTGCGEYKSEVIKAASHTEVIDKAVAATCTQAGKTEGKHCSVCNTVLVAQTNVPAKGHTEVIDKAVAATCTTAGKTEGKHCSVCNTVITAQTEVPAKGHTETLINVKEATEKEEGYTGDKVCSVCQEILEKGTVIPAKGVSEKSYGDATGDGQINSKDVVRLRKYLAYYDYETGTSTEEISDNADATGDGKVNSKDVVRLRKYLAEYDYETGSSTVVLGPNGQ